MADSVRSLAGSAVPAPKAVKGWTPRHHKIVAAVVTLALVAAGWALLAPPILGGRTSFAITNGTSMLPHFHAGDLVLLRKEPTYHIGEVAGYHNGQLHVVVMHRIVAISDGHYQFKGDNNDFVDSFEPTKAQIVGAEWVHLPGVGRYVEDLHVPAVAAVLCALLWLFSFRTKPTSRRRRRRRRHA